MRTISPKRLFASLALLSVIACGGGSSSPSVAVPTTQTAKATGLAYTDPTSTGWRLMKDPSSTATHLVLNLVGPTGLNSRGAGFNLKADGKVAFGKFPDGNYVQDAGVYELFNGDLGPGDPGDPTFVNAGILNKSGALSVAIFQKDRRLSAKDSSVTLLSIALDFDASTTGKLDSGTAIALSIPKAKYIHEDIGTSDYTWDTINKSQMENITIAVGTLKAH